MQYHPLFRDKIDQLGDQVLSNAVANGDIFTVPHRLLLMSTWVPGFDPKAVRSYVLLGQ
jgi:nitroreductase